MFPWLSLLAALAVGYATLCLVYYLLQERLIFVRHPLSRRYRYRFNHPFEERWITAADGAELHGLYFPVEHARGVVLYFHGNTGTLRRWGKRAPRFTRSGYAVLMPEPRGYGKSKGKLSEEAILADALQWYDHLCTMWPEDRIVVYGRSLGSGSAVPVAAQRHPRNLVLESPFARLIDPARNYFRWLPYRLLLNYRFANDVAIRLVRCPVCIFHGERDGVVPIASALRLYASIPTTVERQMIVFPTGHHNDLARFARYHRILRALLDDEREHREDRPGPVAAPELH
ncbi:MAG: alpha/beta fold hydrolase [Flavobacteriales bacterium]|nr:alpha/beta fold hydrolase [Flavobacteriales bacterium]